MQSACAPGQRASVHGLDDIRIDAAACCTKKGLEMELKVYRIDRSFIGRVGNFFKKPDLPASVVRGAMGVGVLNDAIKVMKEVTTPNCYILSEPDEISRFRNPYNEDLVDDVYYIRHPKTARTNWLIPATRFHAHVIGEQISEIVSYIRANASVKYLRVSITDMAGARLGANAVIKDVKVEGKAEVSLSKNHEVIITCHAPLKASEKRNDYVWINDFQTTRAAIDEMASGRFEIRQRSDFSAGLSAEVAKMAGVSAEFTKCYDYHVECEVA